MAKEFGVPQGRISQDLKEIRKEWAEQTAFDLDGVGKCIERRCKLLGLGAPQKRDLTLRPRLTDEERRRRLMNLLSRYRRSLNGFDEH